MLAPIKNVNTISTHDLPLSRYLRSCKSDYQTMIFISMPIYLPLLTASITHDHLHVPKPLKLISTDSQSCLLLSNFIILYRFIIIAPIFNFNYFALIYYILIRNNFFFCYVNP